jgi:DNA-binding transcriptional ArsR family regulator
VEDVRIWKALGSPHRRALLDALKHGPRTTSALCDVLPQLSRYAVMQHLGVLEQASASQLLAFERHLHSTAPEAKEE